ncbi:hypothetical protein ABC270_11545 [Curtobacterium sp. 1P10AnD]|uniref:hypothetical protein n=1 Tax=Curtobacterium sp. 1P10AnD TaxID=3132283 RepID=UPI00399F5A60
MRTKKTVLAASLTAAITGVALMGASATEVRPADRSASDERAVLEALSSTQSRTEIEALVDGDAPVSLSVDADTDTDTGKVLAARILPARAFVPVLPDCAQTVVCAGTDAATSFLLGSVSTRTRS